MSGLLDQNFDWEDSTHRKVSEVLPDDAPSPLEKHLTTISYHDANLFHNVITGRSLIGMLHFLNKTLIDWYSKKQATIETATYESEYSSARTCLKQIADLKATLHYLGIPIRSKSFVFGDTCLVVDSSMTLNAKIYKSNVTLSFYCVREAIVAKIIGYYFIPSKINLANILSKHQDHP